MALLLKNARPTQTGTAQQPLVDQWIKCSRPTDTLPATTTETLFTISGGRILLKALIGEVTTAIQNQANNLSIVVDSDAGAADDLASALNSANAGVGTMYSVEGDGTALLGGGIGWGQGCLTPVVIGPGVIQLTTSATNTGSIKWDLYYQPIDLSANVVASAV